MIKKESEWLEAIAVRAKVETSRVDSVLASYHIVPTPVTPIPRRLMLTSIKFSGIKNGVDNAGDFMFEWKDLHEGLWAMMTERNLRGKSSIIEIVRWLLRGKAPSNLQDDVRSWIREAQLRFKLDDTDYEILIECIENTVGKLLKLSPAATPIEIGSFSSDRHFELVMSDFFLRAFSMDTIATWRDGESEDQVGQSVIHGWPALSGAMFIGTNYDVLLGDLPVTTGTPSRLLQMYLGVPWVSTLASANTALKQLEAEIDLDTRRREVRDHAKQFRLDEIKTQIEQKRKAFESYPTDDQVRKKLVHLNSHYKDLKKNEAAITERLEKELLAERHSNSAYLDDRRELQTHLDSMAAGSVFRLLNPSLCPRCDHVISETRKEAETKHHYCSICGESISNSEDADLQKAELESRIAASKAALDMVTGNREKAQESLNALQLELSQLAFDIDNCTAQLGTSPVREQLAIEISMLEGRLIEAEYDPTPEPAGNNDLDILKAIVTETESRAKSIRETVLGEVSTSLLLYAKRFGMHSLSRAELRANTNLLLVKGGAETSFSKVTKGERLRLKVATVLAMIEIAERRGVGRHPGLLIIDSPGAQEIAPEDLEALFTGLNSVAKELPHLQIFIAGIASKAMLAHIPATNRVSASGENALW